MTSAEARLVRPIFLVGMGRSGTTLLFEWLATHPDLGWFAHHANRRPSAPALYALSRLCDLSLVFRKSIERSDQRRAWVEKLRLGPAEAYETWASVCGEAFRSDWLLERRPTPAQREATRALVASVLRWSGKSRFAAKLTGPPRMGFLHAIFPDAVFVHVIRDGRAVARSLLEVDFWRDTRRMHEPAWTGGFPDAYVALWRESGGSPLALAALQWRFVIEVARREAAELAPGQYFELRYEDCLADPHAAVDALLARCGLPPAPRVHEFVRRRFEVRDMTARGLARLSPDESAVLERLIGETLRELGYRTGPA